MDWLEVPYQKLWLHFWQITALTLLVLIATSLPGLRRPAITSALWLLVVLKTLIPPVFPSLPLPLIQLTDVHAPRLIYHQEEAIVLVDEWLTLPREDQPPPAAGPRLQFGLRLPLGELRVVFAIWLGGVALAFAASGLRWYRASRIARDACPISDRLATSLDRLYESARVTRQPRIVISHLAVSPQLHGLFRPVIVLPAAIMEDRNMVNVAVAHELAHLRRGDLWIGLAQTISLALWWFHPLVWLAQRRLSHARELCTDGEAIELLGCTGAEYAHGLMNVLTRIGADDPADASAPTRDLPALRGRIDAMLRRPRPRHAAGIVASWSIWACLACAVLPGSNWRNSASLLRLVLFGIREDALFETQGPFEHVDPRTGKRHEYELVLPASPAANVTWHEAKLLASRRRHQGKPGRLAIVDDRAKHEFLEARFSDSLRRAIPPLYVGDNVWIGLSRHHEDRAFRWIDGSTLDDAFWHPAEPNNIFGEEHWVHYWMRDNRFSWNDAGTDDARRRRHDRYGFIVEY